MARPKRKEKNRLSPAVIQSIREGLDDFDFKDCEETISLKAARINAGFLRVEVAEIMGVTENTVYRWENGSPYSKDFIKLCKLYRVSPTRVRFGENERMKELLGR